MQDGGVGRGGREMKPFFMAKNISARPVPTGRAIKRLFMKRHSYLEDVPMDQAKKVFAQALASSISSKKLLQLNNLWYSA